MDNDFEIKLTEEELDAIVECFESDRAKITEQFGFDADIQLQLFKTFKQQTLGNQEVMNRVQEQKTIIFYVKGDMTLVLQWLNIIMLCGRNLFKLRKDPLEILLKILPEIFFR